MIKFIDHKVLVTTNNWFYCPDGKQYRAVWGTLKAVHEAGKELGFIPNRAHANWFIEVGDMIIMGCQVMYLIGCPDKPNVEDVEDWSLMEDKNAKAFTRPTAIFITE